MVWSENCANIIPNITTQTAAAAQGGNPARERIDAPTNAAFKITHKIICASCYFINKRR